MSNTEDFLTAWKRGISLAGHQWFQCNLDRGLDEETKWDYRPHYDLIVENIGVVSSTERAFLIAMYSFFNCHTAQRMATDFDLGSVGAIAACLDEPRRRVIADLLISYEGW